MHKTARRPSFMALSWLIRIKSPMAVSHATPGRKVDRSPHRTAARDRVIRLRYGHGSGERLAEIQRVGLSALR